MTARLSVSWVLIIVLAIIALSGCVTLGPRDGSRSSGESYRDDDDSDAVIIGGLLLTPRDRVVGAMKRNTRSVPRQCGRAITSVVSR